MASSLIDTITFLKVSFSFPFLISSFTFFFFLPSFSHTDKMPIVADIACCIYIACPLHVFLLTNKKLTLFTVVLLVQSLSYVWCFTVPSTDAQSRPPLSSWSPPLSPGVCSNSSPLSQWCHPAISASADPFSFCLQSSPASVSFPMSWLFTSGGQVLELQLQHQPSQWIFRVDFL